MKLDSIIIGKRHRTELGNLQPLADSIRDVGLLHPVVVTPGGILVAGGRRIEATKLLGWSEIPVTVAATLDDAAKLLMAEHDENRCRLDLTPWEAEAMQRSLLEVYRPAAAARQREAGARGKEGGRGKRKTLGKTFTKGFSRDAPRTRG